MKLRPLLAVVITFIVAREKEKRNGGSLVYKTVVFLCWGALRANKEKNGEVWKAKVIC